MTTYDIVRANMLLLAEQYADEGLLAHAEGVYLAVGILDRGFDPYG